MHVDAPRLAAHLAILDVILLFPTARVECDDVLISTIGTDDGPVRIGSAGAERKFIVEIVEEIDDGRARSLIAVTKIVHIPYRLVSAASNHTSASRGHVACDSARIPIRPAFGRLVLERKGCYTSKYGGQGECGDDDGDDRRVSGDVFRERRAGRGVLSRAGATHRFPAWRRRQGRGTRRRQIGRASCRERV